MTNLVDLLTPDNLVEEQDKFFSDDSYNPIFHYAWQVKEPKIIFRDPRREKLWHAVTKQNNNEITAAAQQLFEVDFNEADLSNAKRLASLPGKISAGSANEYAELLRQGLDYFGLNDIEIILSSESGFNSRPRHKQKQIIISKDIHFSFFSMEGGVHHELVHVLRYRNGEYNQVPQSVNYLPTEEGLASWCQDNTNDDNGVAQHAIEYLASQVGINSSLREIYNTMRGLGMDQELAWKRACRHKFGFVDTSLPGDIMKPAMYFANEMKVGNLSTEERTRLFVGKINLKELSSYPQYSGIWPESLLIEYFRL